NAQRKAQGKKALGDQALKKNFAEGLSRALAPRFANVLRTRFVGILPDEQGKGQESKVRSAKGFKKLDVNYSTPELGLGLGVSIKTINYRDAGSGRYTKNYTRVDAELRAEASDYHDRQPWAVMVAVVFLPVDACDDGLGKSASSFGGAVQTFRFRAKRETPQHPSLLFERVFIGLYDNSPGPDYGNVFFFDVVAPPPKQGRPAVASRLTFDQLIGAITSVYDARNQPPFEWADAEAEPLSLPGAAGELPESGMETDDDDEETFSEEDE
ncbi:MAG TPA: hypothetical protein VG328_20460, partial [Stellaceae bacterium]|nr:hypothetical protein [Stellaceae bacterium]